MRREEVGSNRQRERGNKTIRRAWTRQFQRFENRTIIPSARITSGRADTAVVFIGHSPLSTSAEKCICLLELEGRRGHLKSVVVILPPAEDHIYVKVSVGMFGSN